MLTLLAALLAAVPTASGGETWAVLPLEEARGPDLGPAAASLARALAHELPAGSRVLEPAELRALLGLPRATLAQASDRLDAAELYYFQLDLAAARAELEAALADLEGATVDGAREHVRSARLLSAMMLLAENAPGARDAALQQLVALAGGDPDAAPDPGRYPPEVLRLFAEARARVDAAPHGSLTVRCHGCGAARIWIGAVPAGSPGEALRLPAGRHTVVVTGERGGAPLRSRAHPVDVAGDAAAVLEIDLGAEGLDAARGALRFSGGDAEALAAAGRVASWTSARVATIRAGEQDGRRVLHLAVAGGGRPARAGTVVVGQGGEAEAMAALARIAARAEPAPASLTGTAPPARAAGQPLMTAARWCSAGLAVGLGGVGTYLVLDANHRQGSLGRQIDRQMDVSGRISDPAGAGREIRSIEGQKQLGGALLAGGAVLAAGTVVLLLVDGSGTAPDGPALALRPGGAVLRF